MERRSGPPQVAKRPFPKHCREAALRRLLHRSMVPMAAAALAVIVSPSIANAAKLGPGGMERWAHRYDGPAGGFDHATKQGTGPVRGRVPQRHVPRIRTRLGARTAAP
jgi:hypothetical protein